MKIQKIIFILLFLSATFQIGFAQKMDAANSCSVPFELKFEKTGVLFLLLEPQYFQPQELKTLFHCLSQKRANLDFLYITALSNEEQLNKSIKYFTKPYSHLDGHPVYYPKGVKPEEPPPPNYYRAYYKRYKIESFEYSPKPQEWKMTTVILKKKGMKKQ